MLVICCLMALSKLWSSLLPSVMSRKPSTLLSAFSNYFSISRESSIEIHSSVVESN